MIHVWDLKNYFVFQSQIGKAHGINRNAFFMFLKNGTFLTPRLHFGNLKRILFWSFYFWPKIDLFEVFKLSKSPKMKISKSRGLVDQIKILKNSWYMYGKLKFSLFFKVKLGKLMDKNGTLFSRFSKMGLFWRRDYKMIFWEIKVWIVLRFWENFIFEFWILRKIKLSKVFEIIKTD